MTLTVRSASDANKFYFVELDERNHATNCQCPDRAFRHHECKHMKAVTAQVARALAFAQLKAQYDVREAAQQAARREQYCALFAIYGD